jgi:hypothetical protein
MNKLRLLTFLLLAAFFIQSCKKETIVGTAYTTAPFQANINGATWAPDTLSTAVSYNTTAQTKTFVLSGTHAQKQISMSVTISSASNTPGFATGTYNIDSVLVTAQYKTQVKDDQGNYVFLPHGTVGAGAGIIYVNTVDSVKKQITGTFQFYSRSIATDGSGAITIDNILGGEFTKLPYTYTSN